MTGFPRFDLAGQTALVTGAARGIGRSLALALADAGADVALGLRDATSASDLVDEITSMGRRAEPLQMDVLDLEQVREAVAATVGRFGRLDILVNNAGIGPENPAIDFSEADYDLTMDVNVKGTFFTSQAAARVMIEQGHGRIINIGSQAGTVALPGEPIYCTSKAAIAHLTKCLAVEWGVHGITVNTVAPTFILTPGTASVLADDTFQADVLERIAALHTLGDPMDVAGAVIYLASPAARLVTGITLLVDGGWTAR